MTPADLDALVARLNLCGKGERLAVPELCAEAADALAELRAEVARIRQMLDTAMELLTAARGAHD